MKTQNTNPAQSINVSDFDHLYELYSPSIFKMINEKVSNNENAEHLLISTFVYAFNHYYDFENSKSSLFCWLVKIMNGQIKITSLQNQSSQIFQLNNPDVIGNMEFQI